jgi:HEAT repeat protein
MHGFSPEISMKHRPSLLPKSEIRNPKFETNSRFQIRNVNSTVFFWFSPISEFVLVSNFVLRASNFARSVFRQQVVLLTVLGILTLAAAAWAAEEADPSAAIDKSFATLATFSEGANVNAASGDLVALENAVVAAANDPARRKAMEQRLIAFLGSDAGPQGKALACKHLVVVGGDACVPALAKLLGDEKLSYMARYVLERIPGPASLKALRDALDVVGDAQKLGVISSLGRLGDAKSAGKLAALAQGANVELAAAAVAALGKIDDDKAARAVAAARGRADLRAAASDASLTVAARHAARGRTSKAAAIYKELFAEGETSVNRVAALQGLARLGDRASIDAVIGALGDKDPMVSAAALPSLRQAEGSYATECIAAALSKLPPSLQPALLLVLSDRGDAAARPAALAALDSGDPAVRSSASKALAVLGDGSCVARLADVAAADPDNEAREAARSALARMTDPGVDRQIVDALKGAAKPVRLELISALGARGAASATGALIEAAGDPDAAVRVEALKALRRTADGSRMADLAGLLVRATDDGERREAELTAAAVAKTIPEDQPRAAAVLASLKNAGDAPVKCSLLRTLGAIGDARAVDAVAAAAKDPDAAVADTAVRVLSDWPDAAPVDVLAGLAETAASETQRLLALRGCIRMIGLLAETSEKDKVARYQKAIGLATRPDEKTMVLSKLGDMRIPAALDLARQFANDPALAEAAKLAADKIEQNMSAPAQLTASTQSDKAAQAMDGKLDTRWDTGAEQTGGEWFLVDLGVEKEVGKLVLDTTGSNGDFPRGYEVFVSNSRDNAGTAVAKGEGSGPLTEIAFTPKIGRYVKIVQTGHVTGLFWSIHELKIEAKPIGG